MQLPQPTLQTLISDVRVLLSSRDPQNSFWSDQELTTYLNDAINVYFVEAVHADEGYFTVQTGGSIPDLTITANTETIALPSDCYQVKNVWRQSTNAWIIVPYANSVTESYSTQGTTDGNAYSPVYTFQGNNLVFRPTPQFTMSGYIRLEYLQFPDTMVYGGDVMTSMVSPIFKQLIVMYACYKAKLRESMVNGVIVHQVPESCLTGLYKQFKESLPQRSKNPTAVVAFNPENA